MACTEVIEPLVVVVNPFLQVSHVGCERRLITDRRGNTAEERRNFRARLGETEDIVDGRTERPGPCRGKSSATVSPVSATRARAPGGSFIWP